MSGRPTIHIYKLKGLQSRGMEHKRGRDQEEKSWGTPGKGGKRQTDNQIQVSSRPD